MPKPPPPLHERLEAEARERLARKVFEYFFGGADDEVTLDENMITFDRVWFRPRILVDVGRRDLTTTVLGQQLAMPLAIAPMAYQRLVHPDGEVAMARAAAKAGIPMVLSTLATTSIEEVVAAAPGPIWFQLYVWKDRERTKALVERVAAAGASALVVTVDAPIFGHRRRDEQNRFYLPDDYTLGNLEGIGVQPRPQNVPGSQLAAYFAELGDPSFSWRDIEWLRSLSSLPIVLKGVVTAEDARLAADHGAAAVVVSNHGGRQLDSCVPTLEALPEVADAAGDRLEVWMDGGVRNGRDVAKALALGAQLVLLGRFVLWGLSSEGEDGAFAVLSEVRADLDRTLALCGCARPRDLTRAHVRVSPH